MSTCRHVKNPPQIYVLASKKPFFIERLGKDGPRQSLGTREWDVKSIHAYMHAPYPKPIAK
jgi:hypothetical protein